MLVPLLAATLLVGAVQADDGWSLAKLNPFKGKSGDAAVRMRVEDQLAEARARSGMSRSEQPSTWARISQGTQDFFGKTKDVLMPWTKDDKQRTNARSRPKPKKKPSIMTAWLKKERPQRPKTVVDFLGNDRPGF
jgi:hypothetical protein